MGLPEIADRSCTMPPRCTDLSTVFSRQSPRPIPSRLLSWGDAPVTPRRPALRSNSPVKGHELNYLGTPSSRLFRRDTSHCCSVIALTSFPCFVAPNDGNERSTVARQCVAQHGWTDWQAGCLTSWAVAQLIKLSLTPTPLSAATRYPAPLLWNAFA